MADEEIQMEESPAEELDQEAKDPKKGLSKILKLVIAGVGGLVINGVMAYYLATAFVIPEYFSSSSDSTIVVIQEPGAKPVEPPPTPKSSPSTDDIKKQKSSKQEFLSVKHIVINPYGTNGRRFLAMDMSVGVSNGSAVNELRDKDAQLRDRLNTFLSRKTVAELTNVVSKRKIKKDIKLLLNKMLEKGEVNEIYFTKYVLQ